MPKTAPQEVNNTYSLSPESIRFVEATSSAITRYYDSLTEEQMEEDRAWGKASESQFL